MKGIRRRANNVAAGQINEDLGVLNGALKHGGVEALTVDLAATTSEGQTILDSLTRYLHESADREHLDKDATIAWLRSAKELRGLLVAAGTGPPWMPAEHGTDLIANTGTRAQGVITSVRRIGGNEQTARLDVSVSIHGDGREPIVLNRSVSIAVFQAPRVGNNVEVSFDPQDRSRFVFRPAVQQQPDDRVDRIRQLGELLADGLLTRDEFDREKARLLTE
jgi:hypothetical protein